jgi:hypothetical protein
VLDTLGWTYYPYIQELCKSHIGDHLMKLVFRLLKSWLPLAVAISVLSLAMYAAVQQALRSGANDPQVQMAEDAAAALAGGASPASLIPAGRVDLASSLAPYLIIFDANGSPLASNALLHDQIPVPPAGVLDYTRQHGEDRITWQPEPGVRSATVILPVNSSQAGFVLAGRSLREVERRETQAFQIAGAAWLAAIGASFVLALAFEVLSTRLKLE